MDGQAGAADGQLLREVIGGVPAQGMEERQRALGGPHLAIDKTADLGFQVPCRTQPQRIAAVVRQNRGDVRHVMAGPRGYPGAQLCAGFGQHLDVRHGG
jgi:hypothetical protein